MVKKAICPVCGASVRKTNLRRHMRKAHSGSAGEPSGDESATPGESLGKLRRYRFHLLAVVIVILVGIFAINFLEREKTTIATFETNLGTFKVELDTERAPITAGNFIDLAKSGFYDGLTFHRVVQNFVIQGGDPKGDGSGGSDKNVPWENTTLKNEKYTIAMARAGNPNDKDSSNTATSQFFISLANNTSLDSYTYPFVVFGRVVEGFEVVDKIGSLYPPGIDGPPTQKVVMKVIIEVTHSFKG